MFEEARIEDKPHSGRKSTATKGIFIDGFASWVNDDTNALLVMEAMLSRSFE